MIATIGILLAVLAVHLVVLVALFGWAGEVPRAQKVGLCMIAAGLVWAGPGRFSGAPIGLGDLLMLTGILTYGIAVYGKQLKQHFDEADGSLDGRVFVLGFLRRKT
jgi:hypothetical protein